MCYIKTDAHWDCFADVLDASFFPHGAKSLNKSNHILYVILQWFVILITRYIILTLTTR